MIRNLFSVLLSGLLIWGFTAAASTSDLDGSVARWDFDVYVNDKKIGKHRFEVSGADGQKRVESEANFQYKILFIPAYRYEHRNSERWADNCLVRFEAKTNANGKHMQAFGERKDAGFKVVGNDGTAELPECVMTFAYWNPLFLQQSRLLNPQSGEYLDVQVEELATELLDVRGKTIPAVRYRLTAKQMDLTIWYSQDDEWLALESVAKGGNVIRYELT